VAWATPNDGLRGFVVQGHTLAPHVAASAKAILAFQPRMLADKALAAPLPKLTLKTKTKRKDIDNDYSAVRENGYATCWDEMEVGMGAIAVPIHLPDVGVIYSLGTAGLIDRLTRRPIIETVNLLRAALEPLIRTLRNRELTEATEAGTPIEKRLPKRPADVALKVQ
jgi:DNA-binding IclR family transcriptional regulator